MISEIESGKYSGPYAAAQAYGIKGACTVTAWLRRYGRSDLVKHQVLITTMEEHDEKKVLRKRVRELEKALADTHMKGLLGEAYLEIACEKLGVDPSDFKKSRHEAVSRNRKHGKEADVTLSGLCRVAGISRQASYAGRRERQRKACRSEELLDAVRRERMVMPRVGTRKLQVLLRRQGGWAKPGRSFAVRPLWQATPWVLDRFCGSDTPPRPPGPG